MSELAIRDSADRRFGEDGAIGRDDAELVRAAKADPEAFGALHRRYRSSVYQYLRTRTQSDEDAADLTQHVFLKALDALPRYHERGLPFASWLFRIARNAAADAHRRRRSTVAWERVPEALHPAEDGEMEESVLRREQFARLQALLATLDADQRELVMLRFSAELTLEEIAAVVGSTRSTVHRQLGRALELLKERYHAE